MQVLSFDTTHFVDFQKQFRSDQVAVFPSDTSYGFSASAFSQKAIERIRHIKNRPEGKPFLLLVSDMVAAQRYGMFSAKMQDFAAKHWNTNIPTTILVPKQPILNNFFPQFSCVGLRIPVFPLLREFLSLLDFPLISTSANLSGSAPMFDPKEIQSVFGDTDILFANYGKLSSQPPSQIWKEENTKIVRVR